jgi:hypothetical protein
VARRFPRGGVTVELAAGTGGDADCIHVSRDATGEAVVSFGLDRGLIHAVGPISTRKVLAEAATMAEVIARLTGRGPSRPEDRAGVVLA